MDRCRRAYRSRIVIRFSLSVVPVDPCKDVVLSQASEPIHVMPLSPLLVVSLPLFLHTHRNQQVCCKAVKHLAGIVCRNITNVRR